MFDKMKQLMEFKKQADILKKELESSTLEVNAVEGIKIVISGAQDFRSIEIDARLLSADNKNRIEDDLLKSINAAVKESQSIAARKMSSVMPGL